MGDCVISKADGTRLRAAGGLFLMPRQLLALLHQRLEGQRLPWESATSRAKSRTAGGNTRQIASTLVARDEQKTT